MASEEQPAPGRTGADSARPEGSRGEREGVAISAASRVPGPPVAELIARASAEVAALRPGAAHDEALRDLAGGQVPSLAGTLARARVIAAEHGGFAGLDALARAPGDPEAIAADAALAGLKTLAAPAAVAIEHTPPRAKARPLDGESRTWPADTPATPVAAEPPPAVAARPEPALAPLAAARPEPVAARPEPAPAPLAAAKPEPAPAPVGAEPAPAPVAAKPEFAPAPVEAAKPEVEAAKPEPAPAPVVADPAPAPVAARPEPAPAPVAAKPEPAPAPIAARPEPAPAPVEAARPEPVAVRPEPAPAPVASAPAPAPAAPTPAPVQPSEDLPEEVADAAIEGEEPAGAPIAKKAGRGRQIDIAGPGMLGAEIEIDIANIDSDLLSGDSSIDADLLSGDASIDADLFTGDAELDALLLDDGPAEPERQAELAAEVETLVRPDGSGNGPADRAAGPPVVPAEPPRAMPPSERSAGILDDWLDDDIDDMDELSYSIDGSGREEAAIEATTVGPAHGGMFADEPTALQPEQSASGMHEVRGISDEPLPPLPIDGDAIPVMASDERASAMALPLHDFDLDDEADPSFELDDFNDQPADAVLSRQQQQPARSKDAFVDPADMPTHVPKEPGSMPSPLDEALDELEFDADLELDDIEIVESGSSEEPASAPARASSAPAASTADRVAAGTPPYSPQTQPPSHAAQQGYPTRPLTPVKASPLPPSQSRPALPGLPPLPGEPAPNHAGAYPAVPGYPAPSTQPPPGYPPYPATPQAPYVPAPAQQGYPQAPQGYPQAPQQHPAYPQAPQQHPAYPPAPPQNPTYPVAPTEQQQRPGDDDDDKKRGFFGRIFKK